MRKKKDKPLKWRDSRQIAGVQANLQGAINACDDGAYVTIDIKIAHDLVEICEQAKHTEVNHEFES